MKLFATNARLFPCTPYKSIHGIVKVLLIIFIIQYINMACTAQITSSSMPENLNLKYGKWVELPTNSLVKKGRDFLYVKNNPDSALVCFSIATSRYNEFMSSEDKKEIFQAFIGKWYAQFFHYYDYPKAYESLLRAQKISEELGTGKGMVSFNLALMYEMFSLDGRDKEAMQRSESFLKKAFKEAIIEKDTNVVHLSFSNIVSSLPNKQKLEELRPYVIDYENFNEDSHNPMTKFNTLLYSINLAIADKDYDTANELLNRQLSFISSGQPRYIISNLMSHARIAVLQNDYSSAEKMLMDAEKIAKEGQMKDVLLNIYDAFYKLFKQKGDKSKELNSYHEYLSMKDTLLNYRQIAGFNQIHFLSEMGKMDEALAQIEYKRQMQFWIIVFCILVCIVLLSFLFIILKKNRKLSSANLSLYEKNKKLMEKEETENITQTKDVLKRTDRKNSPTPSNILTEEKRNSIMKLIFEALKNSDEIYSPKFTISKLAEIIATPAKQVSQVINDYTGDNFNALINRYRIKRACHMLDDIETYGGYTIENIGLNVGFRSRTAFISSFKKITGLTPSDYLKAAKQAKANIS